MGQPITLYDKNGTAHTVFGAAYAAELVASGEYSYELPEKPQSKAGEKAAAVETSEETGKAAAPRGKAGKSEK